MKKISEELKSTLSELYEKTKSKIIEKLKTNNHIKCELFWSTDIIVTELWTDGDNLMVEYCILTMHTKGDPFTYESINIDDVGEKEKLLFNILSTFK